MANRPTDEELKGMVTHIRYEIDEFRRAFTRWVNLRPDDEENWTIEASLLHYRILRDFLITPATKVTHDDDVVAAYYVDRTWPPEEIPEILASQELQDEVNKRLAHLTTARLVPLQRWPALGMYNGIEKLIEKFKKQLRADMASAFASMAVGASVLVTGVIGDTTTTMTTDKSNVLSSLMNNRDKFFRRDG